MISKIKEKLEEVGGNVQYGVCRKMDTWDCVLIRKRRIERSGKSRLDYSRYLEIKLIRENEIRDGEEEAIIEKMKELGWKKSGAPIDYEYTVDANEIVIEIASIEFTKAEKRVC